MYELKVYRFDDSNEYEYKYCGNYGARGEKRLKKSKITTEAQQRLNQKHKEKNMRRLIKANFKEGDLWVTLKYPAGKRRPIREVLKDKTEFLRKLRGEYKKAGAKLKFVYRVEIGKLGGIHIHFIMNNCAGATGLIREAWKKNGHINFEFLYKDGDFGALAEYVTKPAESDTGQMYFEGMGMEDKKAFMRYGCSRNLVRPVPEIRRYSHWTMRRILQGQIKPTEGYYIDKSSVRQGVNPYTGYSFLNYTERRLYAGNTGIYLDERESVPRGSLPRGI